MRRLTSVQRVAAAYAATAPKPEFFAFSGGWDQVSSPLEIAPGRVVNAQNFEAVLPRGYGRIRGYERLDGRPKPSAARYAIINVTITGAFAVGNTITGATSAATGVVLAVVTSSTPNYLVITKLVGTFQNAESLRVGGVGQGTASSTATVDGASTTKLHAQYNNLAADNYRADIGAVPGSGVVRGVFHHLDVRYAFRDNAGGTACALYKSTTGGWSLVNLGRKLAWTTAGAGVAITDGQTVTGATSGATAVVTRAMLETGTWATGTGKLVFASVTGTFQNGENIQVGGATKVVANGADAAITLGPGGRYEFVKANFGGSSHTKRVYGCDGVNQGFEFDGTIYCPINTRQTNDTPTHVSAFQNYLFFSFVGSAQFSSLGTPYMWTPLTGAGELALGDSITGFALQPGAGGSGQTVGALAIYSRQRTDILYGTDASTWAKVTYRDDMGAFAYTIQDVGYSIFLDDRGLTNLLAAQAYGNFSANAISIDINTFMQEHKTLAISSCVSRDKSQYRLFFSDKFALYVTVKGQKVLGIMPILFTHTVRCAFSGELSDGSEEMLFGSDDGYVFQMDRGTSCDGDDIEYYFDMPYLFSSSPLTKKAYKGGRFEITGTAYAEYNFTFTLGYGGGDQDIDATQALTTSFSAGRWDSGVWDSGFWDGRTLLPNDFDLTGSAENIGLRVGGSSDYFDAFVFHGVILTHSNRRQLRP